jgi:hypothetical protein
MSSGGEERIQGLCGGDREQLLERGDVRCGRLEVIELSTLAVETL